MDLPYDWIPKPIPKVDGPALRCHRCRFWAEVPVEYRYRIKDTFGNEVCWGLCTQVEQQEFLHKTNPGTAIPICFIIDRNYWCQFGEFRE